MPNNDKITLVGRIPARGFDPIVGEMPGEIVFGIPGKSAYQLAVENGYEGTVLEWLDSLQGKSAYAYAVDGGYAGTEEDFARDMGREKVPLPTGAAEVGQYLRVLSVDENGKITGVEAVEIESPDSGDTVSEETVRQIVDDYLETHPPAAASVTINGEKADENGNFIINTVTDVEIARLAAALT